MNALFFISIACFFGLFVIALAIARHVRIVANPADPISGDRLPSSSQQESPSLDRTPLFRRDQSLHHLAHRKEPDWRFLVSSARDKTGTLDITSSTRRKPPASVRPTSWHRPDWAYFNKDLGDLSDPYQPSTTKATWADSIERESPLRHERTS